MLSVPGPRAGANANVVCRDGRACNALLSQRRSLAQKEHLTTREDQKGKSVLPLALLALLLLVVGGLLLGCGRVVEHGSRIGPSMDNLLLTVGWEREMIISRATRF